MTPCKSSCTKVFTSWLSMPMKQKAITEAKPKSSGGKTYQNGRERPHFFGFQPPKKCVGSLPP